MASGSSLSMSGQSIKTISWDNGRVCVFLASNFMARGMLIILTGWVDHIWPAFFGGCSITRPTDEWLSRAGEWESFELRSGDGVGKYDAIPHVFGKLVKK